MPRFSAESAEMQSGFYGSRTADCRGATISYQTDESVNKVVFYYETAKGKVIHFRNQEDIAWTKD